MCVCVCVVFVCVCHDGFTSAMLGGEGGSCFGKQQSTISFAPLRAMAWTEQSTLFMLGWGFVPGLRVPYFL